MANPYIKQQADAIATNATTNLNRNILPQFRRGAVASGGWGNSGVGIAQGIAAGDTSRAIADAQGNLYGAAYEGDQNRATQMGIAAGNNATQRDIAAMNDATSRYGLANSYDLGGRNIELGYSGQRNQYDIAQMGDQTQRYGIDANSALGFGNLNLGWQNSGNQYDLGIRGINQQKYATDQGTALGWGGIDQQRYATDQGTNVAYAGIDQQRYNTDTNAALGWGGLDQQRYNTDTQSALGWGGLDQQRYATDTNAALGWGGLDTQRYGMDQNYEINRGNLDLGWRNSDNAFSLGLGGLANQATANSQNFYTAQRGQDLTEQGQGFEQYLGSLNAQLGIGDQLNAIGDDQYQTEYGPIRDYSNIVNPYTGLNNSQSTTGPEQGGGFAGAVGAGMTAAQLLALYDKYYGSGSQP